MAELEIELESDVENELYARSRITGPCRAKCVPLSPSPDREIFS
jgi:hypothetical protein